MKFKVTREHIDSGIREECCSCPIALAVKPNFFCYTHFKIDGKVYMTPQEVFNFVHLFDSGVHVEPFEFELKEPYAPFE